MKDVTVNFVLERETKGAIRFYEVDKKGEKKDFAEAVIGTLYLRKSALDGNKPEKIAVTISKG